MSIKWTNWETQVIEFFASFNKLAVDKYTARSISEIWNQYYPNFPERSASSISHKLREVKTYDIKNDFIIFLENSGRSALNVNDIAIHYSIPLDVVETFIDILETKVFNAEFYNRETRSLSVKNTLDMISNNSVKVIHAPEFFKELNDKLENNNTTNTSSETETIKSDTVPFSKQVFQLGNTDKDTLIENSKDSNQAMIDKIKELQFELDNAHTAKNRRKALKKTIKKYKKQLGLLTNDDESKKDETNTNEIDNHVTEVLLNKVNEIEQRNQLVHFKLGIISDTHIGSKWFDEKALHHFYSECSKAGVCKVIHAGDLYDGSTSYAYQEKDQNIVGYHNQFNWIVKNYPRFEGISTYVVAGNHDVGIMKKHNIHPIIELAKVRYDIKYSGDYYTDFNKHGVNIRVIHCDGANYTGEPMSKMKSLIDTTYNKCHIFIMGHLHQAMELHDYGDVQYAVAPGCFVKPNEYTIRRSYVPAVGGFIVDVIYDPVKDKLTVNSKWVSMND